MGEEERQTYCCYKDECKGFDWLICIEDECKESSGGCYESVGSKQTKGDCTITYTDEASVISWATNSDLERFVALYESIGITLVIDIDDDGNKVINLSQPTQYEDGVLYTFSDKFDGYPSFYSDIVFDGEGKFIKQGFWE